MEFPVRTNDECSRASHIRHPGWAVSNNGFHYGATRFCECCILVEGYVNLRCDKASVRVQTSMGSFSHFF